MERIWLKEYPPGVPHEIDPFQFPSLVALADDSLRRHADHVAYELMGRGMTYAEIDRLSAAFAC
ncbi:MAG TPA: hypothetical protein VKO83_11940, partial [Steroidobacteraceae bacterium]|nr:hypothetical protein [Steroidobacteraceae bacterium]